ncbi:bactofilin family protein [Natrarchaeobaculum aegyptiacum]|uniref:Cell shape determination protein CcmA n=1 Tax=Natrarchaeobaculum aegyptiacum TaxID=745377 RepID=A0A2Z2HUA8_9EURY|nr:polymer-forming cytoskeletal protein [Natrarchaeobaculum aegyptiacum]ARS90762.1 cell shape determination protein CcmA [Natrarchaeobaculum aegyptiacum]
MRQRYVRFALVVFLVGLLLASVPATAVAQSETGVGGGVVVQDGETVDSLEGVAGSVVVEEGGTVTGDVSGLAGDVRIHGTVEGDVSAAAGSLVIDGEVASDVSAGAGNVLIAEDGEVDGSLQAGAGTVQIDGAIGGDVAAGAETVRLGDEASIEGDLTYGGSLEGNTDAVAGDVTHDPTIGPEGIPTVQPFAEWAVSVYALALNLLLGAALLLVFPRFSATVARRVATSPVRSGFAGLGALVLVPVALVALLITILGIPIAFAGAFLFALYVWIAVIYGRFAVAAWILGRLDVHNRWLALLVGLVGAALIGQIPYLGGLVNFLLLLLGLGAVALALYDRRRAGSVTAGTGGPADGPAE